jgi:hypothetical protein
MKKLVKKQTGGSAKKPVTVNKAKLKDAMKDSAMANELSYYMKKAPREVLNDKAFKRMEQLDSIQRVPSKVRKGIITKKMGGTTKTKK